MRGGKKEKFPSSSFVAATDNGEKKEKMGMDVQEVEGEEAKKGDRPGT